METEVVQRVGRVVEEKAATSAGGALGRERVAVDVARRYYLDDESMADLAGSFGVSRSTISRWIRLARERGWVSISIVDPLEHESDAARYLRERFDLATVVSVATKPQADMLDLVGRRAAEWFGGAIGDHSTIGVAWGTTTAAIASWLRPSNLIGCTVVQLNGAGSLTDLEVDYSVHILGQFCTAWNAAGAHFPVPAFFDDPETRTALWEERSIKRVLGVQRRCDVAVFSVGSADADPPSRVYVAGYLSATDRRQLAADGVVGDIATHFYDRDGRTAGIELNRRASGLPPEQLRRIPERFCVAAGRGKAEALAGALRGGYVTALIADSALLDAVAVSCRADEAGDSV